MTDYLATQGMMADDIRPLVLGGGRQPNLSVMVPRATLTTILAHLERLEKLDQGEVVEMVSLLPEGGERKTCFMLTEICRTEPHK